MRFVRLSTLFDDGIFMVRENWDRLVRDFDIVCGVALTHNALDAETVSALCSGSPQWQWDNRMYDVGQRVISNAYLFKCASGNVFMLTMPHVDSSMFVTDANKMISELTGKIPGVERLCATVIDNDYKFRSCGCMVGIIATRSVMRVLSGRVAAPYRGGQQGFGGTFSPKASGDVAMTISLPAEERDRLEALARHMGLPIGSLVGRMCDDYCRKV